MVHIFHKVVVLTSNLPTMYMLHVDRCIVNYVPVL